MPANPNFSQLVSTTLDKYATQLVDNVMTSKVLLWILKSNNRISDASGGVKWDLPLITAESENTGSYSGDEVFSTLADDNISAASYDWKQYYGLIKVTGLEKAQNSAGPTQVLDLIKSRIRICELTMSENLDRMFIGDGLGNGGKDFLGIKAIVSDTTTLGGINPATAGNEFWKSKMDATAETVTAWGLGGMAELWNQTAEGNDHPTHILTTDILLAAYEGLLTANARYMDPVTAAAGFENLLYKNIPAVFDRNTDTGFWYMLNMNYIMFKTLDGMWFKPSEFIQPINQDVVYKHYLIYGQLGCDNRKRQALHTALTP